jgi:LemA protein
MQRISGLEDAIADRREFYNDSVNINNVRIEQFPDNFVARLFGFGAKPLLTFSEEDRKDVDVKALFAGGNATA